MNQEDAEIFIVTALVKKFETNFLINSIPSIFGLSHFLFIKIILWNI
jgi:hypothetical protein